MSDITYGRVLRLRDDMTVVEHATGLAVPAFICIASLRYKHLRAIGECSTCRTLTLSSSLHPG